MCGIAGKLNFDASQPVSRAEIDAMLDPMAYRGPDSRGAHLDRNCGLGHLRLSIIDVSADGAQPMTNEDGTVWIVFNGEIYNYQALRADLIGRGHKFHSRTDTEVIIHLYEEHRTDCVRFLRGMFTFAIWDSTRQRLFVARDRVGIKPLYYRQSATTLAFASELKALVADPAVSREIDQAAIREFFSFFYLPGEATLFKSVRRLLPGHYLLAEKGGVTTGQYWDLRFTQDRWQRSFEQNVEELHALLALTVRDHMVADVPVGILLSGGVDSSAVLNFAVQGTAKKVRTYTIGFDEAGMVDERPFARMAAERFGAEQHELSISAEQFWDFLPRYAWHMEDPVCEPPAVALYYISRLAREHVTVLLSGEGGDEAFAGYPNYPNMLRLQRIRRSLGPLARPVGASAALAGALFGSERIQRYGGALGRPLADHYFSRSAAPNGFFHRQAGEFFSDSFQRETKSVRASERMAKLLHCARQSGLLNQMLYADTKTWLPDDLLVKADKMTMANSLELRVPLLDHEVLEFAASLPAEHKVKGMETKRVLKAAFARALPAEILNRKKAGFPVPYPQWLRGPLFERTREVLLSERAVARGYFRRGAVEDILRRFRAGENYQKEIFSLLVLELWHQGFTDPPQSTGQPAAAGTVGR